MTKEKLPNLIGVGSPRCGTSTLYALFAKSRDVGVCSPKEANYWGIRQNSPHPKGLSEKAYISMFSGMDRAYRIDVTPVYLCNPSSREQIVSNLPDAKVIVTVREPLERLFSHFKHFSSAGHSSVDHGYPVKEFDQFVSDALSSYFLGGLSRKDWKDPGVILSQSIYFPGVRYFYERLGACNILVLNFSDLAVQGKWVSSIASFLDLDAEQFMLPPTRMNASPTIDFMLSDRNKSALESIFERDVALLDGLLSESFWESWQGSRQY